MNEKVISPKYTVNTAVVCEILSYLTTTGLQYFTGFILH